MFMAHTGGNSKKQLQQMIPNLTANTELMIDFYANDQIGVTNNRFVAFAIAKIIAQPHLPLARAERSAHF